MITPIPTTPRHTIQARFPDGRAFEAPTGTPIEAFVEAAELNQQAPGRVVAVLMNHRLRELSIPLKTDADLVPITTADSDGSRIYRRSLTFLMVVAAAELFPAYTITIMHSMPFGGYYCEFDGVKTTQADLDALKKRMRQMVDANLPINQVRV
ncbi:MAG TPA: nucleoside kinase, partial [Chloroflexota bacterium]|nr:nucleoside kinase [Chloroflexota bacterium]